MRKKKRKKREEKKQKQARNKLKSRSHGRNVLRRLPITPKAMLTGTPK